MRKIILLSLLICGGVLSAQKTENWKGDLNTGVMKLPITLELRLDKDTVCLMGSPSQSKELFKAKKTVLRNDSLLVSLNVGLSKVVIRAGYSAQRDSLCGTFTQSGATMPIYFTRSKCANTANRPQTPKNIDYICEEVSFRVPNVNYQFKGTLTYPAKGDDFPAIVLISGSGLQNRDEEVFQHKPFAVIADYMARNGIAVLRYDDRGWESTDSTLFNATTLDYAQDAEAAFGLLVSHPKIDHKRIGLAGHSEGGIIAPIVASRNPNVAFVILLAGTGVSGEEVLIEQNRAVLSKMGYSQETIEEQVRKIRSRDASLQMGTPWLKTFLDLDPSLYLSKVTVPVLAMNGEKDVQVIFSQNLPAIERALKAGGNRHYRVLTFPNLNHLFQNCETGLPNEYYNIEETISTEVLNQMRDFIREYVL